jgi:hypothetical protein
MLKVDCMEKFTVTNNKEHSDFQIFLYKLRRPKNHIRENAKFSMLLLTEKQTKLLQKGLKTMTGTN